MGLSCFFGLVSFVMKQLGGFRRVRESEGE